MINKAFTLIELLIVVAIIGILAAIAVPNFLNAQLRAKIANAVSDMRSIDTALEMYKLDKNIYPPWQDANGTNRNPVNRRLVPLTTPIAYMSSVPQDPFIYGPPGTRVDENQHVAYVTYDYVDAWALVHFSGATMLGNSFRCSEWRIASAGPDGTMTFGSVPSFDATNGLKSWGDIVRTGPRTSVPCDDSLVGK
ncbi:MAG: prepilin-type N-terminal cleavage/methylation domain-containing protein [Candidatus Omnitrophota bacterium]|jgi:type II secretion system protein G|nr:MAG: prepilin-type N-terminal cleavage/methylation domain-containing protein [Candidatus Omnitrophota bacterium]